MIAPSRIGGRAATPRVGAVNNVVVNQRGAVQEFYHGSQTDRAATGAACMTRREKQECGAQALPAPSEQVRRDFRNGWKSSFALPREFFLDKSEIVADQIKNLFDRQQRDGVPPKLFTSLET